ncbi:MAG: efflux RND transporter periplasmic adaptor subunit [Hyphomonadaceae bacterium]|nr:efflux RND transporter periplasmic adaptor subunit [Hyphomonadaceae bacterium]
MKLTPRLLGRLALPAAAVGAIGFAVVTIQQPEPAVGAPAIAPPSPSASLASAVAAVGLVEPSSEAIDVATELSGVVREVMVKPGQHVRRGEPLFRLDTRALDAQVASARAALNVALVESRDASARLKLFDTVTDARAVSADERDRARFNAERAEASAALARAQLRQLETDLARLTVRAPIAGEVLKVNVRPGEFAQAGLATEALLVMGATDALHVRVQIDEEDMARVAEGAVAEGALRGDATRKVSLRFVRFEPQALPKQNLNGGAERVDTRVVEAIYAFDPAALPAYVGQQMDVFVAARPVIGGAAGSAQR